MKRLSVALLLAAAAIQLSAQTVEVLPSAPSARMVRTLVDGGSADLHNFYAPAAYALVWTNNGRPTAQALAAIAVLENAAAKGLDPADYGAGSWAHRVKTLSGDAALARFDVELTSAVMRYASDVRVGRVNPQDGFAYDLESKRHYLPSLVAQITTATDATAVLGSVEPQHEDYRRLLAALAQYRRIEAESKNDGPLPVVPKLAPGQTYDALPQLATLLRRLGDLPVDAAVEGTTYEGALVEAVRSFQSRHGLDADGVIGRSTFAQLNVPPSRRIEQIELALERWRWIPSQLDGPAILVNVPEFRLRARNAQGEELTMRVVVGKAAGHRTPLFQGEMKYVVFRPYWSVPPTIQRNEIAPKVERDPGYLARNGYEVVDATGRPVPIDGDTARRVRNGSLTVRQKPGNANALGLVKFLFPNDNNIYLHSTPQQALFARTRRDFSHGCIRVEDPAALAEWTLRAEGAWTREKIEAAMHGKRDDVYVKLANPIPVMLMYATAAADETGRVSFFEDIYGHDVQLAKALAPETNGAAVMVAAR